MLADLRFALRQLAKAPGFTLVAVVTLALGVGANTAIFSVIDAVLLHPFPYADSDRLLFIASNRQGQQGFMPVTYPDYLEWKKDSRSFDGLAWASGRSYTLTGVTEPAAIRGAAVSASVWPLLGIAPQLGRPFTAAEDRPGADPVCVLSYATWQGRFGGDAHILGRTLTLDGKTYSVVGVMPARFKFWAGDVWLPAGLEADSEMMHSRVLRFDSWVVGRPRAGISIPAALAELNVIAARIAREHPDTNQGVGVTSRLLSESVVGDFRQPLLVLLAAVGCVLLIACANVANLLLARAATRQREYAVRMALGATRGRLIRQLLLESLPLALMGGGAGLLVGAWGLQALLVILPSDSVPAEAQIAVNVPVMCFTLAVAVLTMGAFSLVPALAGARAPVSEGLQEGSRGTASARTGRLRAALIVSEIALSVTLLVGAGLLIRSLARLQTVDLGFNTQTLLTATLSLPESHYPTGPSATEFYARLVEDARRIPGVKAVGAATAAPFLNSNGIPFLVEGRTYHSLNELQGGLFSAVLGDYFAAQDLRLVKGRLFTPADRAGSAPVIVLNEAAVKKFLPDGDPLGRRLMLGVPANLLKPSLLPKGLDKFQWSTVVGVVRDIRYFGMQSDPPPAAYLPVDQAWEVRGLRSGMTIFLRTEGDPTRAARSLRQMVAAIDRDQPVGQIATMQSLIRDSLRQPRFNTILLALFAGVALALAVVGIYGVVAWNVAQRTREFGIRQALGADARAILRLVVRHGMRVVLLGLLLGLAGAAAATRALQSMLFDVPAFDPLTFLLVAALLAAVALLACVVPARRATRVDPSTALRAE